MDCETSALEPGVGQSRRVVGKGVGSLKRGGQETVCDVLSGLCQLMSMSKETLGVLAQRWAPGSAIWILFLAILLSPVTLGEPLSLSVPQFPPL